jgi:excisionase family DNA binding protein
MPYITKEQAAKILKTSTRGVERLVSRGELKVTPEKVEGRTRLQPMYDEGQVRALAAKQTASADELATNSDTALATSSDDMDALDAEAADTPSAAPSQALQRAASPQTIEALGQVIADALREAQTPVNGAGGAVSVADLAHKMTLSFKEAARLSGVPESHLRSAYAEGKLRGAKIGRGVRVSPDALKAYVAKVLK